MKIIFTLLIFSALIGITNSYATHNRAGEITYKSTGGLTVEITINTYTKESSTAADREFLEINYGDWSEIDTVYRINGPIVAGIPNGESIGNDVKKNVYRINHTYPYSGVFSVSLEDPNRNEGVVNITNSSEVPFYIESRIFVYPGMPNSSSEFLAPAIYEACIDMEVVNLGLAMQNTDFDSLYYELIDCRGLDGNKATDYYIPSGVTINPYTGLFTWVMASSLAQGEYNFSVKVSKYRGGTFMGHIVRDFQLTLKAGSHHKSTWTIPTELTVATQAPFGKVLSVGDTLEETILFSDQYNPTGNVTLESFYLASTNVTISDITTNGNSSSCKLKVIYKQISEAKYIDIVLRGGMVNGDAFDEVNLRFYLKGTINTTRENEKGATNVYYIQSKESLQITNGINLCDELYQISSISGMCLKQCKTNCSPEIDVSDLCAGIYFITLINQQKTFKYLKY